MVAKALDSNVCKIPFLPFCLKMAEKLSCVFIFVSVSLVQQVTALNLLSDSLVPGFATC